MYPILSPNIHCNRLSEEVSVLTNLKNMHTKKITKYHQYIFDKCIGLLTVQEIKDKLQNQGISIDILAQVEEYLQKVNEWGYIIWSPTQNYLSTNAGISRKECWEEQGTGINEKFTPNGLNSITMSILDSCCLKCGYCSQSAPAGKSDILSYEKTSELIKDAYKLGARYLGLFGGEPLMHPNIIEIIRYAHSLGYRYVNIFTRGTLIDHKRAKELRAVGINRIQVTVDSHIPSEYDKIVGVKGSFDRMFRALYYLQDVGISIDLKSIVTKDNISRIFETVLFFKSAGINIINLEVVVAIGRADFAILPSENEVIELEEKITDLANRSNNFKCNLTYLKYGKPKQCGGGINSIFIFADGETTSCDKTHFIRKEISFGNVHELSLKQIWKSNKRNIFRSMRNNDSRCIQCEFASTCLGGCILNSYMIDGKIGPDPMCAIISGKSNMMFPG